MASELDIMNDALAHLGEEVQLTDLAADPAPRQQRLFRALLPSLRDATLRKHPWLCAERRLTVTRHPLDAAPDWAFAHVYLLPEDTMRVWDVDTDLPWQAGSWTERDASNVVVRRHKALFAAAAGPLKLKTVERIAYEHMDALLADVLAKDLASLAAGPLQADKALKRALRDDAREALAMAVTAETSEFRDNASIPRGRFLSVR